MVYQDEQRKRFQIDAMWPVGQAVKTGASHAPNVGSIPARVTKISSISSLQTVQYVLYYFAQRKVKRAFVSALFTSLSGSKSVLMTMRVHPFPFRTRKLSSSVPKILGWRRPGKIGRCRHRCSSIAQSVEHAAVNRGVVGSSPTWGASW